MERLKDLPGMARLLARMLVLCCSLVLLQFFCPVAGRADGMMVRGTVYSEPGKPAENVPVRLIRITMSQKPSIATVAETLTDAAGRFEMRVEPSEDNVFFRVSAGLDDRVTGSDPFRLRPESPVKSVQLLLPKIITGLSHFSFKKHLMVVEPLEGALQITEAVYFSNDSGSVVDTGNMPFVKQIPAEAENFHLFERQGRIKADQVNDRVSFHMSMPPGEHQLLFGYILPVEKRRRVFKATLPTGVSEFEMLTPVNTLRLSLMQDQDLSKVRVINQEKQFDTRKYLSTVLLLTAGLQEIAISVDRIPLSQKRFYYPALLMSAVLVLGLFVYLARKPVS